MTNNSFSYSLDDYWADWAAYNASIPGCTNQPAKGKQPAITCLSSPNQALAQQARNSVAWGLMAAIDDVYGVYTSRLYTGKGAVAVGGDTAQLGLTAAATIAHLAATKTIFGALATGVTGVNLSIDKNYFAQQTFQVIALAMETRRDTIRHEITDGLGKNITDYPLTAAKRDLVSYLYAGSLPGGLMEIQKETGAASKASQGQQAGGSGPALLTADPASLPFPNQTVGVASAARAIKFTNTGSTAINLTITITGTDLLDFASQNSTCGAPATPLAPRTSCMIDVVFKPSAAKAETASVEVSDGGGGAPIKTVALTGQGQ